MEMEILSPVSQITDVFLGKFLFDLDHFKKVFNEFVTTLLLFYVLVFWPRGMWDLGSLTRDLTHTPCTGRQSLNHWTTRKIPTYNFNLHVLSSHYKTIYRVPGGSEVKASACNVGDAGDAGSIPEMGRSPGEGNGNPLQYSCLENPMEGRA